MREKKIWAYILLIILTVCLICLPLSACRHTHEYKLLSTTAEPTCTSEGAGIYQCACGQSYTGKVDAQGHEYSSSFTVDIPATCIANGQKSRHCIRCGDKIDITAIEGAHVTVDEVPATCTKAGVGAYIDCPDCGLKEQPQVLPALGHEWQEETITPADCINEGSVLRYCVREGCDMSAILVTPKTAHTWDVNHRCTVCSQLLDVTEGLHYEAMYCGDEIVSYLVSAGSATSGHIIIPAYYNGIAVSGLSDYAFYGTNIASVTLPVGIKTIGTGAFKDCKDLEKIIYSGYAAQWLEVGKFDRWDDGTVDYTVTCLDEILDKYGEPLTWSITYIADPTRCDNFDRIVRDGLKMGELSKITASAKLGYRFIGWSDGLTTATRSDTSDNAGKVVEALFEYDFLDMPVIAVDTAGGAPITSKEDYVRCTASVLNADIYNITEASAKIRGRGNSTWTLDKKPYRLKFDEYTDLFGNGAARDWTLIANHCDKSLVRNYLTYSVAELFDSQRYTTTTQFVELYLNGVYEGVYAVHEQTQTGSNRVDIDENFDESNPSFLIELDRRAFEEGVENKDYFSVGGDLYAIKTPDTDLITYAQTASIKHYLQVAYDIMCASGKYSYAQLSQTMDVRSFAEAYVINELVKSGDIGFSSFYMYRDKGGKLTCGPLWDYDLAMGNIYIPALNNPNSLVAADNNTWFRRLLQWQEFRQSVTDIINDKGKQMMSVIDTKLQEARGMSASFNRNFERWKIWDQRVYREPDKILAIKTWEGQLNWLKTWLTKSMQYMTSYYNCNRGVGNCPA